MNSEERTAEEFPAEDENWREDPFRLFYAVGHNMKDECELLLEEGDDINLQEPEEGWTALGVACLTDSVEMARYLIEKGAAIDLGPAGTPPLIVALLREHSGLVEMLVSKGADVNIRGSKEMTPLFAAAITGNRKNCELLLKSGADPGAKSEDGLTAADYANDGEIKKMLRGAEHGDG